MLDTNFIRNKPEDVKKGVIDRGMEPDLVDKWLKLDEKWRRKLNAVEDLRSERNQLVEEYKQKSEKPPEEVIEKGRQIKEEINRLEKELNKLDKNRQEVQMSIPNLPASDVPYGKSEEENIKIRDWGEKKDFSFQPKNHLEIGEQLGIIDVQRAAKVSGPRFGYFIGDGALLEMALMKYAIDKIKDHGFKLVIPPVLVKKEIERAMGYVEHGNWREMYQTVEDGLVLVSSSEHSVIPMHKDETFREKDLPIRYVNFSTCFRREAGSYGKDTLGMFRVHQFNKVEMNVYTLPDPEISDKVCLEMVEIQEEIIQGLDLPYQIVASCTGDLPFPNRRMYDLEAWFPAEERYRETHSCSNCTDFQTRRLEIKLDYQGETKYVHALNGTGVTDRVLLAILENNQQEDGSVIVPEALQDEVGKQKITRQ